LKYKVSPLILRKQITLVLINQQVNQKEFANAVVKFLTTVDGIEIVN